MTTRRVRCAKCSALLRWARDVATDPLPACKTCGDTITGKNRRRALYCSHACRVADPASYTGRSLNRVTKVCRGCGVTFAVPVAHDARFNYCTLECSLSHRGVDAVCGRCGGPFRHGAAGNLRRYCCETCRRPPLVIDCTNCGTAFRVVPSKEGRARYCSRRCYVSSGAETSIERRVREVLERLGVAHEVQVQVGPWVVDFLLGTLVIEADGDYWHTLRPDADRRKTADLESRGLTVWRLPECRIVRGDFPEVLAGMLAGQDSSAVSSAIRSAAVGSPARRRPAT